MMKTLGFLLCGFSFLACGTMDYESPKAEDVQAKKPTRSGPSRPPAPSGLDKTEEGKRVESFLGEARVTGLDPDEQLRALETFFLTSEGLVLKSALELALVKKQMEVRNLMMAISLGIGGFFGVTTYLLNYSKFKPEFKAETKMSFLKTLAKIGFVSSACGAGLGFIGSLSSGSFSPEMTNLSRELSVFQHGSKMTQQDVKQQFRESVFSPGEEEEEIPNP